MPDLLPLFEKKEIRVIAPSYYKSRQDGRKQLKRAEQRLGMLGLEVTYGMNVEKNIQFGTASPNDRIEDLHSAYTDENVAAIIAYRGGSSANELLPHLDWDLVGEASKPLIGYSDITVLHNAIFAKTGNVGFLGPNFRTLGSNISWEYTLDNLSLALQGQGERVLKKSTEWGETEESISKTKPWKILSAGQAEGILIGGNLGTFYLLQGTEYQPSFSEPFIFAMEDDEESGQFTTREISRRLESLLQLPNFRKNLSGIIIGRFQSACNVKRGHLESIVDSKNLSGIPIIGEVDFGHTLPMLTLPIGGKVRISTDSGPSIVLL